MVGVRVENVELVGLQKRLRDIEASGRSVISVLPNMSTTVDSQTYVVHVVIVSVLSAPDRITRMYEAAKHAVMEWRLHGQLTDSCRELEYAIKEAEEE